MALSMDEERILAEIEQHLSKSEPALAARLTSFGRSGRVNAVRSSFGRSGRVNPLRSPRIRIVASCLALVTVTIVSLMVYALLPLRAMPDRGGAGRASPAPRQPTMTAPQRVPLLKGLPGPSLAAPSR